ncbi:DUF86 domain-containing protein [Virgibacillus sp. YIM 98842]|jgi:uncharacterized protein YutE (UPF0331/DUF86 family)|uniref:DUF86 domain-containing protein n=1 Tax=Virgibacillus sp. YIM 98842 TaxID=2663533 RepID=UPI0013D9AFF4|nr:DUF86 domain-containing protein [Virgibacillus sp. YIM 98842]
MYFVDRSKIEETLIFIEEILEQVKGKSFSSFLDNLALERAVHLLIESILDVGNMMIDGFIMRDPGSYEDIIDILIDEKVLPEEEEEAYKHFIQLRKMLVNDYTAVDHVFLGKALSKHQTVLKTFSMHIRDYLNNELGVANAFSKQI